MTNLLYLIFPPVSNILRKFCPRLANMINRRLPDPPPVPFFQMRKELKEISALPCGDDLLVLIFPVPGADHAVMRVVRVLLRFFLLFHTHLRKEYAHRAPVRYANAAAVHATPAARPSVCGPRGKRRAYRLTFPSRLCPFPFRIRPTFRRSPRVRGGYVPVRARTRPDRRGLRSPVPFSCAVPPFAIIITRRRGAVKTAFYSAICFFTLENISVF